MRRVIFLSVAFIPAFLSISTSINCVLKFDLLNHPVNNQRHCIHFFRATFLKMSRFVCSLWNFFENRFSNCVLSAQVDLEAVKSLKWLTFVTLIRLIWIMEEGFEMMRSEIFYGNTNEGWVRKFILEAVLTSESKMLGPLKWKITIGPKYFMIL